ncbi:MAG: hypothetical protein WCC60_11290, partial [Ilumatobacteraceae bacterium]
MHAIDLQSPLWISSELSFGHRRVSVSGPLTVKYCWELRDALLACPPADCHSLTVDLSEVDELDAAGFAAVTSPMMCLRRRGHVISVV